MKDINNGTPAADMTRSRKLLKKSAVPLALGFVATGLIHLGVHGLENYRHTGFDKFTEDTNRLVENDIVQTSFAQELVKDASQEYDILISDLCDKAMNQIRTDAAMRASESVFRLGRDLYPNFDQVRKDVCKCLNSKGFGTETHIFSLNGRYDRAIVIDLSDLY